MQKHASLKIPRYLKVNNLPVFWMKPTTRIFFLMIALAFLAGGIVQESFKENRLYWETSNQANIAGFNIFRAEKMDGEKILLNSSILPVSGDRLAGHKYEYLDRTVRSGKIYYYWIEVMYTDQSKELLSVLKSEPGMTGMIFYMFSIIFALLWILPACWADKNSVSKRMEVRN
jgi:hypothetical protein